jgi:hypothetical protein
MKAPAWTGLSGKTLWDLLQLLVIPMVLAIVGAGLGFWQAHFENVREDNRQQALDRVEADRARETVCSHTLYGCPT